MPFQCTLDVVYVFQSILFNKTLVSQKKNMVAHLAYSKYILVTFVFWLLFHGIFEYSC